MATIIEELWYGNLAPQECGIFNKREFKEMLHHLAKRREELEKALSGEQKELLQKFMDARNEFDCLAEKEIFLYVFKLGGKMAFEMMVE